MIFLTSNQWKCDTNRPAWEAMGMDCSSRGRVGGLLRAYRTVLPDVLAMQEVSRTMENLLMDELTELTAENGETVRYQLVSGGDTPILFRRERFFALETGFYLFPEEVPGFGGSFNNARTKSYSFAVLEEIETGKKLVVFSAHLWWKTSDPARSAEAVYQAHSDEARAWQIGLVTDRAEALMAQYGCPGVIMGDFNAGKGSLCMQEAAKRGWADSWDQSLGARSTIKGHHYCDKTGFGRPKLGTPEQSLDHIIVKGGVTVRNQYVLSDEWFDCISDHYPLYIEAELT